MELAVSNPESARRIARLPAKVRRVHLVGVAGSAMAALAGMFAQRGFEVSGSDEQFYEPAGSMLRRLPIQLKQGFSADHLTPPPDLAVIGNVITRDNVEARAVLERGIPYLSMPEALSHFFLADRIALAVTGTHGKSTSTALMAYALYRAGRKPSMLLGGVAKDFASNYRLDSGAHFVVEGDEYDTAFFDKGPKFMHYRPAAMILTGVEFDHADIYRDLAQVKSAFRALAESLGPEAVLAVCADSAAALEVTENSRARRVTFGLAAGEVRAADLRLGPSGARFSVVRDGIKATDDLLLGIGGRMNVANALGVYVLLERLGIDSEALATGFASFQGVARRQEVVAEAGGVTIIDDFAHHPTAVRATLSALAPRFPGRRLVAAFEPRSNTARRRTFQAEFASAFDQAAVVFLAPVYFKPNDPIPPEERLDVAALAREISARGPHAAAASSLDDLASRLSSELRPGDVVVLMSNGPFGGLAARLAGALASRP